MVWKEAGTSCPVPGLVSESCNGAGCQNPYRCGAGGPSNGNMGYAFESEASELRLHEKLFTWQFPVPFALVFFPGDFLCDDSTGKW